MRTRDGAAGDARDHVEFVEQRTRRGTGDATSVRIRGGKTELLNGPYADTREQLGGYFMVDVPDLDAALHWAARCPSAPHGTIEVRPVWAM